MILSLDAFLDGMPKLMEMGPEWVEEVRARLGAHAGELQLPHKEETWIMQLLAWQSPRRDPEGFIDWYAGLTPGRVYELIAPYLPACATDLLRVLDQVQARQLRALRLWYEHYFRHVDPAVIHLLEREAAYRKDRVQGRDPVEAMDEATTGLVVDSAAVERVLLVPQYHFRPLNWYGKCGPVLFCLYPVESPSGGPGQPSTDLMRLTRALGDENRLRILHFLAGGSPRSFTEVQKFIGLAKNTVHYHLSTLRCSGLVRIHLFGDECGSERYTARRATLDQLGPRLQRFLDER
jgi:DNA-binding transcriptional ArsR family regulator